MHHFSAPYPGLSLNVCLPPRPHSCLCPSHLPSGGCTLTFHCYHIYYWAPYCDSHPCTFPHPISLVHFDMPTFRCLNAQISQTYVCVEQGMHCWVTAVQLVTLKGVIWRSPHTAMMLMSLWVYVKCKTDFFIMILFL